MDASPFNGVKLELGIIILGAVLLLMLPSAVFPGALAHILILLGYGLAGLAWVVWRALQVSRGRSARNRDGT